MKSIIDGHVFLALGVISILQQNLGNLAVGTTVIFKYQFII